MGLGSYIRIGLDNVCNRTGVVAVAGLGRRLLAGIKSGAVRTVAVPPPQWQAIQTLSPIS